MTWRAEVAVLEEQARQELAAAIRTRQKALRQVVRNSTTAATAHERLEQSFDAPPPVFSHARRVAILAQDMARSLNLSGEACAEIAGAGLLHDIGKLALPEAVLSGEAAIGDLEMEVLLDSHARTLQLLEAIPSLAPESWLIRRSREWWDGSGGPDGLRGWDIPIGARILAVADAIETVRDCEGRPTREPATIGASIARRAGTRFDPDVVRAGLRRRRPVMLMIVGLVVVIGAVVGGFLMAGGVLVLNQPSEFIVIGGAAIGSMLISTPAVGAEGDGRPDQVACSGGATTKATTSTCWRCCTSFQAGAAVGRDVARAALRETRRRARCSSKYPKFLARHEAVDFLADSVKVIIVGGIAAHDLEALMDEDLKVAPRRGAPAAAALTKIGDALPGLGIVAAVLGIVITMGHIDGPPAEIGHHVGAALVGTFLGILLSYGFVQPLAGEPRAARRPTSGYYCMCIKAGLLAHLQGQPAGDRRGVRAARAAARRASVVQRDRAVLPRRGHGRAAKHAAAA